MDDKTAQPNAQRHEKKSIFTLQVAEVDCKLHCGWKRGNRVWVLFALE